MIRIKLNSPIPIYEQLTNQFVELLKNGILKSGESIPSIRKLASQLDVSNNTVARAYQDLERMGIIEMNGQKGSFIRTDIDNVDHSTDVFKDPILELIQLGLSRDEITALFHRSLKEIYK